MAMQRCPNGHMWDDSRYSSCPYDGIDGLSIPTRPFSHKESIRTSTASKRTEKNTPYITAKSYISRFFDPDFVEECPLQKIRIFISSTSDDLRAFREIVFCSIQELGGNVEDMRYWSAHESMPLDLSLQRVRGSDLVILIVAHRYGFIPEGRKLSITEMEYEAAKDAGIPVLAFVIDPDVPWPPKYIERDRMGELDQFKKRIAKEVTYKSFRSQDDLKALAVTALVSFAGRYNKKPKLGRRFIIETELISPIAALYSQPDAVIEIGQFNDRLPLLLKVKRSVDIHSSLLAFQSKLNRAGVTLPDPSIDEFRQIIEYHSMSVWAKERIFEVQMSDKSTKELYVTSKNLSELFRPLFNSILMETEVSQKAQGACINTVRNQTFNTKPIESVGGTNRFLGISLLDGAMFSVGQRNGIWVEWREFLSEDLLSNFPGATFEISAGGHAVNGQLETLAKAMHELALDYCDKGGGFRCDGYISISRQAIGLVLAKISSLLATLHSEGKIHGDLKPENVLLTKRGPVLVDAFEIAECDVAPGWTPDWSAPEQILGRPIGFAADIYPLGKMVAKLIQGRLVGEVRLFRAPGRSNSDNENFELFFNPIVYVNKSNVLKNDSELHHWVKFAQNCLRFDPAERILSATSFTDSLQTLLNEFPLTGEVRLQIVQEAIPVAAKWIDGSESVARLMSDIVEEP